MHSLVKSNFACSYNICTLLPPVMYADLVSGIGTSDIQCMSVQSMQCHGCQVKTIWCSILASFPGPTQLFVACNTEKQGEPGTFAYVRMM